MFVFAIVKNAASCISHKRACNEICKKLKDRSLFKRIIIWRSVMNMELLILGENVRRVRQSLKCSQEAMADMCGLQRTYVCDIERGARNVTIGTLLKLALGLGTTVSELTRNVESGACSRLEASIGRSALTGGNTTTAARRTLDDCTAPDYPQNGFRSKSSSA
jgi:transcriptional regulator with XRE-family HTH domain